MEFPSCRPISEVKTQEATQTTVLTAEEHLLGSSFLGPKESDAAYFQVGSLKPVSLAVRTHSFVHLTLVLLLHYLVKCRSRILAVYNSEFILDSACVG